MRLTGDEGGDFHWAITYDPADFGFLNDGKAQLWFIGVSEPLALIYEEIRAPEILLSEATLIVEGTPIPEPSSGALALVVVAWFGWWILQKGLPSPPSAIRGII